MRKMVKLAMVICLLAMLVGCDNDEPVSLAQELEQTHELLEQKMSKVDDELFWVSATTATTLISNTYNADHEYAVSIMINVSDGKSYVVERRVFIPMVDEDLRELYRIQLLLELVGDEIVVRAFDAGNNVIVNGSSLMWYEFDGYNKVRELVEVYDLDNDGFWDPDYSGT